MIEHVEQNGIECSAFLGVRQDHDAQILFRHKHDTRHKTQNSSSVAY